MAVLAFSAETVVKSKARCFIRPFENLVGRFQTFCLFFGVFLMKKSLIALAVLAASGAAMAQSSVTIYGLADVYFGSIKNEVSGNGQRQNVLNSGGVNTSRWGIKGSEDLGGGLKANFLLEQGFNVDDGTAKGTSQAFARQSYVGFSGGFGEVKLGKMWTAYDDVSGAADAVFDSALSPETYVFNSVQYSGNPGNTIYYVTPTFAGFSGAVSYSLGENKTTTTDATSVTAFNISYASGPLTAHVGYQVETSQTLPDQKFTRVGGSYDFGVVVAKAQYGNVKNFQGSDYAGTSDKTNEYQIGVDVPVSSALTLSVSYAKSDDDQAAGVFEQSRKGYGLGAAYTLSKRTFLYGGYTSSKFTQSAGDDLKIDVLAVGVQHKF
jgi:predicted porin